MRQWIKHIVVCWQVSNASPEDSPFVRIKAFFILLSTQNKGESKMPEHPESPSTTRLIYRSILEHRTKEGNLRFQFTSNENMPDETRTSIEQQMKQAFRLIISNHNL
jgi:hypothetical protein